MVGALAIEKMTRKAKKPFFYFEKLEIWEKVIMVSYAIFSVIFFCYTWQPKEIMSFGVLYGSIPQLCFGLLLYKALRNLAFYLYWFFVGIIHLLIYLFVNGEYYQQMSGNYEVLLPELRNTIILLLLFQVLRWISIKVQKKEFVIPSRGDGKDLFDNRVYNGLDFLLFGIYMASFTGLSIAI